MAIKGLKDFVFENYHRRIEFPEKASYYSVKLFKDFVLLVTKLIEKISDASNAKEDNKSYLKRKITNR